MAWEAISKADVLALSGARATDVEDVYYDMAVAILADACEVNNIGSLVSVTDRIDGSGTKRMAVNSPPISSVTSVAVDGVTLSSTRYENDTTYVVLVDTISGNPYASSTVFNKGTRNVVVTYTSGTLSNDKYGLAVALIVAEFIKMRVGEAADTRIQFGSTNKSDGKALSRRYIGVHTRAVDIAKTLFTKRMRAS